MAELLETTISAPSDTAAADPATTPEPSYAHEGSWEVHYKPPHRWIFDVSAPTRVKQEELLKSFLRIVKSLNIPPAANTGPLLEASQKYWLEKEALLDSINRYSPFAMSLVIAIYLMVSANMMTWLPDFGDTTPAAPVPAAAAPAPSAVPPTATATAVHAASGGRGGIMRHHHRKAPVSTVAPGKPVPGALTVTSLGDERYKITWNSVGDGFKYRVYTAKIRNMAGARLRTYLSLDTPEYKWNAAGKDVWLAVSAVQGIWDEGPMSRPVHITGR